MTTNSPNPKPPLTVKQRRKNAFKILAMDSTASFFFSVTVNPDANAPDTVTVCYSGEADVCSQLLKLMDGFQFRRLAKGEEHTID